MRRIDLDGTWRFRPEGGDETTIEVPGFWEAQGHLTLDGRATYERVIELAGELDHATLRFGAVADLCDVFVNDEHVAHHEVGFTPFEIDVSGRLHPGDNVIRVEVIDPPVGSPDHHRTPQGKQGWAHPFFPSPPSVYATYGGIWQPCTLELHGPAYVTDVWCDMDPDAPNVGVAVRGEADEIEIRAFGQTRRVGANGTARFEGAENWSPKRPVLHDIEGVATCRGRPSHSRSIRTGLRRVERVGDDLLLNGMPYRMRSALHQGFWPDGLYAADAGLIERDVRLALDAGLNTLRTHLKAFEPEWLDAADRLGLLLQCDVPIGEPLADPDLLSDEVFVRRCKIAALEQVRRDRSRPSVLMWTLMNEVGLLAPDMLDAAAYRSLAAELTDVVRKLDPARPIVENDWVAEPRRLVVTDVRTPHWYGRSTASFLAELDHRLTAAEADAGPLYVTEFGEWGLPPAEHGHAFWDNENDLRSLVHAAGWQRTYEEFVAGSQRVQGWADRVQAERFRARPAVLGFCLTEWTDVPHELNGLVSLRRNAKHEAIDGFRPALADVAPIVVTERYAYADGEEMGAALFVSNWSNAALAATPVVRIGESAATFDPLSVDAGSVAPCGPFELRVAPDDLIVEMGTATARYPLHVCAPATPGDDVTVAVGELPANHEGPAVLLEPTVLPAGWPVLESVPEQWGPTPFAFTTSGVRAFPDHAVLAHQVFACYPRTFVPGIRGPVGILIPPPIAKWGALVAVRDGLVVCTLSITDAVAQHEPFAMTLLASLAALARP